MSLTNDKMAHEMPGAVGLIESTRVSFDNSLHTTHTNIYRAGP